MNFWINEQGLKKTLFFVPDTKDESKRLEVFASEFEPLTAKIVHNPQYKYPYVEIKKEIES